MSWWRLLVDLIDAGDRGSDAVGLRAEEPPPITLDLSDEPCVRCRKPTRYSGPGPDGLPTCRACRDELKRRREGRLCPHDGQSLIVEVVSNVAVDRCASCGGVWLDGGELELITRAAGQAAKRSAQEAEDLLATVLAGLPRRPRRAAAPKTE